MAIDLKQLESSIEQLDARKRKLEKLRALLNDEETRELISDPEIMTMLRGAEPHRNGNQSTAETAPPEEPAEGTLRRAVLDVARACAGKFDSRYVYEKLKAANYEFGADKPEVSIHGALIYLTSPKKRFVRLVRRGSGRQPNIYEAVRKEGTQ
jgi:hypothetical protein